jgi:hypothetical protein
MQLTKTEANARLDGAVHWDSSEYHCNVFIGWEVLGALSDRSVGF